MIVKVIGACTAYVSRDDAELPPAEDKLPGMAWSLEQVHTLVTEAPRQSGPEDANAEKVLCDRSSGFLGPLLVFVSSSPR